MSQSAIPSIHIQQNCRRVHRLRMHLQSYLQVGWMSSQKSTLAKQTQKKPDDCKAHVKNNEGRPS